MKKVLSLLLAVLAFFTLIGCGAKKTTTQTTENTTNSDSMDQRAIDAAKESVEISTTVTEDFTLPTSAAGGVSIAWASNHKAIAISGQTATVTCPEFEDGDANVTLTATFTCGSLTATKEFNVVVTKKEQIVVDSISIAEALASSKNTEVTIKGVVGHIFMGKYNDAISAQGIHVVDETGAIYVFGYNTAQMVSVGQEVVISGVIDDYYGAKQIKSPNLIKATGDNLAVSYASALRGVTISDISAGSVEDFASKLYILEGSSIEKNESYGSYKIKQGSTTINVYSAGDSTEYAWLDSYLGQTGLNILFFASGTNSSGKWRGIPLAVIPADELPEATAAQKLIAAMSIVSVPETAKVVGSLGLTTSVFGDVTITYTSSNTALISNTGDVLSLPAEDTEVTLTASFAVGGQDPVTKTYKVIVKSATIELTSISDVLTSAKDADIVSIKGVVYALAKYGYYVYDGTGYMYVNNAEGTNFDIPSVGQVVRIVDAEYDDYYAPNLVQKSDPVVISESITAPVAQVVDIATITSQDTSSYDYLGRLVTVTGTLVKDKAGTYDGIFIKDTNGNQIYLNYGTSKSNPLKTYADELNTEVTITIVIHQYHTSYKCWIATDLTY